MENGEVYRATTEAHPGPGRGARSGLAAYFTLSRLSGFRRLKILELVSPRRARARGGGERRPACGAGGRFHIPSSFPRRPGRGRSPRGRRGRPLLPGPSSRPAAGCWDHPACSAGAGSAPEGQARGVPSSLLLCGDLWLFSLLLPCTICQSVRVWTTKCFSIILWFFRFLGANPTGQLNLLDSVFRYYARRRERCTISCLKF